ncbi:MAG: AAA family ATPase, CDC48 subfamily, partial [Methanosarcinales archeaon 56_1174]
MDTQEMYVKVAEAKPQDAGRGLIRLDPLVAKELGIRSGDVVRLTGRKKTAAIAWPGYPEDAGKGIIRMDGATRRNAGCSIDDKVKVKKIEAKHAQKVMLAPTEPLRIMGGEQYLSQILEGRVMMRGDVIELNIMGRKIELVVTGHQPPAEAVIMSYSTEVVLSEKPAKEEEVRKIPAITYEDIGG